MTERRDWGERQAEIFRVLSMLSDGATPSELGKTIGISTFYATVLLCRFRKQGVLLKKACEDGKCRYSLSPKGERKQAYLESLRS